MKNKLPRICFIGCGDIAARHAHIIKKLFPKIELSFASRNKLKAQEFSQKFNEGQVKKNLPSIISQVQQLVSILKFDCKLL